MSDAVSFGLDEVLAHFSELEDPRSEINRLHPLESVLTISVLGVLADSGGPTAIARWAKLNETALLKVLPLPNGVPGKDVFRRVLSTLKPEAFQASFFNWLERRPLPYAAARLPAQTFQTYRRSCGTNLAIGILVLAVAATLSVRSFLRQPDRPVFLLPFRVDAPEGRLTLFADFGCVRSTNSPAEDSRARMPNRCSRPSRRSERRSTPTRRSNGSNGCESASIGQGRAFDRRFDPSPVTTWA